MNATLLLNASYEPLRIISWKKALTLFFAGKVEVIEEYDQQVHAIKVLKTGYAFLKRSTEISGGAPKRAGIPMVPMPRVT